MRPCCPSYLLWPAIADRASKIGRGKPLTRRKMCIRDRLPGGVYSVEALSHMVEAGEYKQLPPAFQEALEDVYKRQVYRQYLPQPHGGIPV